ncbi:TetR/AcrR family transcriptional regulator [Nocardia sp. NPDC048505]|uniref:TetR/AcrR family transcriptional regulator n=1 Tax=unclassified Nocardia TaxID=2637762 RepID=UPI0033DF99E0
MAPDTFANLAAANQQLSLTRTFDDEEQQRRAAIALAAKDLARNHGYQGVTVREVARLAEVSPVTIYRYFGSKDGILRHLMVEWAIAVVENLYATAETRRGSVAHRISTGMQSVIEWAGDDVELLSAGMTAITSSRVDGVGVGVDSYRPLFVELARGCLGDPGWQDRTGAAHILGHVYIACLLDLTAGRTSLTTVQQNMATAATLLLRDVRS